MPNFIDHLAFIPDTNITPDGGMLLLALAGRLHALRINCFTITPLMTWMEVTH